MATNRSRGAGEAHSGAITHRVERKNNTLQVVIEVPLGELIAHLGPRVDQFRARLRNYSEHVVQDVLDAGQLIANDDAMEVGRVKFFNDAKGWGMIIGHDSKDVFVHWRGIAGDEGFKSLRPGQRVRFKRRQGRETMEAFEVVRIEGDT